MDGLARALLASAAASRATATRSTGAVVASRPASARASRSRSVTILRMRLDERSADSAISRCSPASSDSSSSRFARMLVSGVRSSCDASATNSRWRTSVASVSPRAALSSRSMSSKVCARSDTSSLACGLGSVTSGSRVRATSRAARVSPAIGCMARWATNRPPMNASSVPPSYSEGEEDAHAADRAVDGAERLCVLNEADDLGHVLVDERAEGLARSLRVETVSARETRRDSRRSRSDPRRAPPSGEEALGENDLPVAVDQPHLGIAEPARHQRLLVCPR